MNAVKTPCARCAQQLLARRKSATNALRTPWERRVDYVRTLCARYNWQT